MRILQVITSLDMGGAETLVVNLIPRLQALGNTVDLCIFNGIMILFIRIILHRSYLLQSPTYFVRKSWFLQNIIRLIGNEIGNGIAQ